MATRTYRSSVLSGLLVLLFASLIAAGSAKAQEATPSAEPTPPGFRMPVHPPPGWGAEQWAKLRGFCLQVAEKIHAHQPLTPDELQSSETAWPMAGPRLPRRPANCPLRHHR